MTPAKSPRLRLGRRRAHRRPRQSRRARRRADSPSGPQSVPEVTQLLRRRSLGSTAGGRVRRPRHLVDGAGHRASPHRPSVPVAMANRPVADRFRRGQSGARLVPHGRARAGDHPRRCPSDRGDDRRRRAARRRPRLYIAIRTDPAWRGLFATALAMFLLALSGAILSQAAIWWPHLGIPMGATMRLLVIPLSSSGVS